MRRGKRPLVPGIIPPCLRHGGMIPGTRGRFTRAMSIRLGKMGKSKNRVRIKRKEKTSGSIRLVFSYFYYIKEYATSRVAKYSLGMVIFRNAIFENLKCCVLGVNRVRLAGL